jgi:hypothetical protein
MLYPVAETKISARFGNKDKSSAPIGHLLVIITSME